MANIDRRGFRPADRNTAQELLFPVDSGSGTAMFVGDVVDANSAGSVRPAGGSAPTQTVGVVVELFDTKKIPVGHWASAVLTKYLTASTAGYALVALALPGKRFIAQPITGKVFAEADIFATSDVNIGSGDAVTATSGHELLYTTLNTEAQFLILGKVDQPNAVVSATVADGQHCDLYVTFNESLFAGIGKSVGV